jgi:hypothetical protein
MTDPVPLQADWAVWGKRPGTHEDYSVLASSTGGLSPAEFYHLLKHFTPGNPTAEERASGSLPWVVLSRFGVGDRLYLGISLQQSTADRDGVGRPISRTSFFCFQYAELSRTPVSYLDLYEAVERAVDQDLLARSAGSLFQLQVPRLDPVRLAQEVRAFHAPSVAAVATLLLHGPVTITGPDLPGPHERLRFFDAVAALLPYGYRAYLTAATWSDSGAGDRFRMVFAVRAQDEASRVPWRGMPLSADGPDRGYLSRLERVTGRVKDGDAAGHDPLEALIGDLADEEARKPCMFEEPEHAVAILRRSFLTEEIEEAMDAGGSVPDDVIRQLLSTQQVRGLSENNRVRALRQLISAADPYDCTLITQWFDEIAARDPGALLSDVVAACQSRLWLGDTSLARPYLRFAGQHDLADDLFAQLVVRPPSVPDQTPGLDALGRLLREFVIGVADGTAMYPRTQRMLSRNPAAGAALLAHVAVTGPDLESAADWLTPAVDRVVGPFVALLGDVIGGSAPESLDADALDSLSRGGRRESVGYLLRAAAERRRLSQVLPGLATWLASSQPAGAQLSQETSTYWRNVAMGLALADESEAVWLDLALLATNNRPEWLFSGTYEQPQYSSRLAAVWGELVETERSRGGGNHAADDLLESALIEALASTPWRADNAQAAAVLALAQSLTATRERPRLKSFVLNTRDALLQMPPDATPADIAQACARAQREGAAPGPAAEALAASGTITSAVKALQVIEDVHQALTGAAAFDWPVEFAKRFAGGGFGPRIAADFPAVAGLRYAEQIAFRITLLDTVVRGGAPGASPAVDAQRAEYLDYHRHRLGDLLKEARKRLPRGGIRGLIGGKGGQSGDPGQGAQGTHRVSGTPLGQPGPGTPPGQIAMSLEAGMAGQTSPGGPGDQR